MNKLLFFIITFLFVCFCSQRASSSEWADFSIAAPECFGTDYSNMTSGIKNIINCLNINATDATEGQEQNRIVGDIINEFAASLAANAIATRVLLFNESQKKETPLKSTNEREVVSNETQGQLKKISERFDAIIKLESSIQIFDAMLKIRSLPYSEY